jgi:uncharacterized membrane protein YidH (DUF202 family)
MDNTDPVMKLAVERTLLALERTHLAWTRTVIVLMTSGFAIDKVTEFLHHERLNAGTALTTHTHVIGLVLLTGACLLLFIETIYFIRRSHELLKMYPERGVQIPSGIILSILIFLTGIEVIYLISTTNF